MKQSRRKFLRQSACGALSAAALASGVKRLSMVHAMVPAQTSGYKALVCIYLNGGNDSNNMVIPITEYASYNAVRNSAANINIPQASLLPITPPSDGRQYGLHPNLTELHALWGQQKVALAVNCGSLVEPVTPAEARSSASRRPSQLFSHSDQTTQWQTSIPQGISQTGWGGRTADRSPGASAFPEITSVSGTAIFTRGDLTTPLVISPHPTALSAALQLQGFTDAYQMPRRASMDALRTFDREVTLARGMSDITQQALDTAAQLAVTPPTFTFPNTSLGNQLYQIAKLIYFRTQLGISRQIFFASIGGFDSHSNQLNTHVNLYTQVSQAMNAFYAFTSQQGIANDVTTFTISDFGRTFHPSTGAGSDHGWGSHHIVMGGAVRGGDFYGTVDTRIGPSMYPILARGGPYDYDTGVGTGRGRWVPTTSVDQYGATLARWYGVPAADIPAVFPNIGRFASSNLGFML